MGDIEGLMEQVNEMKLDEGDLVNKMKRGEQFTLRDLYEMFASLMNAGPLGELMVS